ncbi:hypothetical protein OAE08_00790 [Gammaproteobacteria bacterium]|nr:hypothetical protein [Gammaproteobacteria bacterium]
MKRGGVLRGGKWVSQKVAYLLDEAGIAIRSLEGGFNAWNDSTEH